MQAAQQGGPAGWSQQGGSREPGRGGMNPIAQALAQRMAQQGGGSGAGVLGMAVLTTKARKNLATVRSPAPGVPTRSPTRRTPRTRRRAPAQQVKAGNLTPGAEGDDRREGERGSRSSEQAEAAAPSGRRSCAAEGSGSQRRELGSRASRTSRSRRRRAGLTGNPSGQAAEDRMRYDWQHRKYSPIPRDGCTPATQGATVRLKSGS